MTERKGTIVIVDDNSDQAELMERVLQVSGYDVELITHAFLKVEDVLQRIQSINPDLVIADLEWSPADIETDRSGLDLQNRLTCPTILTSSNEDALDEIKRGGLQPHQRVFDRMESTEDLLKTIGELLKRSNQ